MSVLANYLNQTQANAAPAEPTELIMGCDMEFSCESIEGICVDAEKDLMQLEIANEQAGQLCASFESIENYLVSAKESGGMNSQTAGLVNNMFAALTAGMDEELVEELPSMESYDADGAALGETELAMESIGKMLKKLMAAIKSMVAAGIAAAKKFYKQYISLTGRVASNADTVVKAAAQLDGVPKADKVKPGGYEYLYIDGKAVAVGDVGKLADYVKTLVKGNKSIAAQIKNYAGALKGLKADDLAGANAKIHEVKGHLYEAIKLAFGTTTALNDAQAKEWKLGSSFESHMMSGLMPGQRRVILSLPKKDSDLTASWKLAAGDAKATAELPALAKGDIKKWGVEGLKLIKEVQTLADSSEDLAEEANLLVSAGEAAVKVLEGAKAEGDQGNDVQDAIKDIKDLATLCRQPGVDFVKYATQVANAAVQYASVSIKNHGPSKKED